MTKSNTKAVTNQSFSTTYNFYWVRMEGACHNNHIHGLWATSFLMASISSVLAGANEDGTKNMEQSLTSNAEKLG